MTLTAFNKMAASFCPHATRIPHTACDTCSQSLINAVRKADVVVEFRSIPRGSLMEFDHFALARGAKIDHGEAVTLARSFCSSGYRTGSHGSLSPCDKCTYKAVTMLIERRPNGHI